MGRFCIDAARRAMASEDLLKLFFPQAPKCAQIQWCESERMHPMPQPLVSHRLSCSPKLPPYAGALHGTLGHGEADWPKASPGSLDSSQKPVRIIEGFRGSTSLHACEGRWVERHGDKDKQKRVNRRAHGLTEVRAIPMSVSGAPPSLKRILPPQSKAL